MKKIFLTACSLLLISVAFAQFPKEKYETTDLTWFGIDYTQCRMVGEEGFTDKKKIVEVYFNAWNDFVFTEKNKYDVAKYMMKDDVKFDLSLVKAKNTQVNPDSIVYDETATLVNDQVSALLIDYDFSKHKGLGAMLFAEYYSKRNLEASYFFVIFDIDSGELLLTKRYIIGPGGFGFRNYWASTFYNSLKNMKYDVKKWLK
ncbi:hypothetical protein SAMN04488029_0533 [Reichenbachiella faecimaris]|uniref:Uncharacterized protein n=1 Tax=Reichenbachiella faecimaris TaxID=692418 RepID=A0A1W2G6F9_REIFA|nr:hypothetical protein [Reichenbachiella faecimaris]SMD32191.1 hypothetical protein SAMN04488029_0533 [Reichenbachiella faecimaris]